MMASVKVAVRVRPLSRRELDMNSSVVIQIEGNKTFLTNVKLPNTVGDTSSLGRERVKQFTYDFCYWSCKQTDKHFASQQKVYCDLGEDIVQSAYEGYNACVFAYGQTGSGKTYTMMGSEDDMGMIPRICQKLFADMNEGATTYRTEVSYLEIYNERVRDLLRENPNAQLNLKVREHPKEGPYVQDLSKHLVVSYSEIEELLSKGNSNRTTAATNMNDQSSRSHAIFTIVFTQARFKDDLPSEVQSKIHLVDLAGSERADLSGTSGERLKEGGSINKSLVTLGNVISTLADITEKCSISNRHHVFIPYRDSVLTWLLKDSLGGNAKTIMIAAVSPAECNYAETLSTLRYASRAKKIVNKPVINEDSNVRLIRELREENARLKELLSNQQAGSLTKRQLTINEERMRLLTGRWADKWQQTASVLEENKALGLRQEGHSIILDSDLPYLLEIDDNILSTGMKLYHLHEGDTTVGSGSSMYTPDILLDSPCLEPHHCTIKHKNCEVYLVPVSGARSTVNNQRIMEPTKLNQGVVIRLGRKHLFRFNHPGEAAHLREQAKLKGVSTDMLLNTQLQSSWANTSSTSLTDSALSSDLDQSDAGDLWSLVKQDNSHVYEQQRFELELWREQQLEAEAQRLAQLAEQEANRQRLEESKVELEELAKATEERLEQAIKAEEDLKRLSESFEQRSFELVNSRSREEQAEAYQRQREALEKEKERAREERKQLRKRQEEKEADLKSLEERQKQELEQLRIDREAMNRSRREDQLSVARQKEGLDRSSHTLESIFSSSAQSMRQFVDQELQHMKAFVSATDQQAGLEVTITTHTSDSDSDLDISLLKLSDWLDPVVAKAGWDGQACIPEELLAPSEVQRQEPVLSVLELFDRPVNLWTPGELAQQLDTLEGEVDWVEGLVCGALHRQYNSVLSADMAQPHLATEVMSSFQAIKPYFEHLEKVVSVQAIPGRLQERMNMFDQRLATTDLFLQLHTVIQSVAGALVEQQYLKGIELLDNLHKLMKQLDNSLQCQIECSEQFVQMEVRVHKTLRTEVCVLREKLLFQLGETWCHLIKWNLPSAACSLRNQPCTATLEVTGLEDRLELLTATVQALHSMGLLDKRVKQFCDLFLTHFLEPIVRDRNTLLQVIDETEKYICVVVNPPRAVSGKRPDVADVYQKLEQVFVFLHKPLQGICVTHECRGQPRGVLLTEVIGGHVCKPLFERISTHCLSHIVPKNSPQGEDLNDIVTATDKFQQLLQDLHFLTPGHSNLVLSNISCLFASMRSHEVLRRAQQLLVQDLSESVCVSALHPLGAMEDRDARESFVAECKAKAGTSGLKLPVCRISVPVQGLACLAYDTLQEALRSGGDGTVHLSTSLYNMSELFCDVLPSYHKERLRNVPLLAALHHNNCMFVAHHLMTIEKSLALKLHGQRTDRPSTSQGSQGSLQDLMVRIRRLGNDLFTDHVDMKKEQLTDHLIMAEGFESVGDDEGESAMKAVKHTLHHLRHVYKVWCSCLPINVYYKAMGTLFNEVISDIITSALAVDEFSVDDCEHLQKILEHIVTVASDYFKLQGDGALNPTVALHEHTPNWAKFTELARLFGMGLKDIGDRWADGKGLLAVHFTPEELCGFVVATFEDSTKRARLLGEIARRSS